MFVLGVILAAAFSLGTPHAPGKERQTAERSVDIVETSVRSWRVLRVRVRTGYSALSRVRDGSILAQLSV